MTGYGAPTARSEGGAVIGRAGFDVVRPLSTKGPTPPEPHNVIPGNLGQGVERIGTANWAGRIESSAL